MGPEFFTDIANREKSYDLLSGFASKHWANLSSQQALLIDITVAIVNSFEPIVSEFNGFLEKRKSKAWFTKHQDEVFLSFFCAVANILQAWHLVDDSFDEQIRNRYPLIHTDFYLRNWQSSNEDLHFRNFYMRVGGAWHQSLSEIGIKVNGPDFAFGDTHFLAWMQTMIGYLEHLGQYGSALKPANLINYLAD